MKRLAVVSVLTLLAAGPARASYITADWCERPSGIVASELPQDHDRFVGWINEQLRNLRALYDAPTLKLVPSSLPAFRELGHCAEQLRRIFERRPKDSSGGDSALALGLRIDLDSFVSLVSGFVPRLEAQERAEAAQREAEAAQLRESRAVESRRQASIRAKGWPADIEAAALARKVRIGMTREQVELAWGKPQRVNETRSRRGVFEQWVYFGDYLYLENGIVTSIQTSR